MDILDKVQQRATKMVKALEYPFCEENLRDMRLFSLERRRFGGSH